MKIMFLTKYPISGASSRYRVYQYLPYLKRRGVKFTVQPFYSLRDYPTIYRSGHLSGKVGMVLKGMLKRLWAALRVPFYRVIYFQREATPYGPLWFERWCRLWRRKLIFDYDDALFLFKPSSATPYSDKLKKPGRVLKIFRLVDCVFAGNEFLRQQALQYAPDARVIHVAENLEHITRRKKHQRVQTVTLGWLGSPSTEKYLELIRPVLEQLAAEHDIRLLIVGGGRFRSRALKVVHKSWTYKTENALLQYFDIGLMPLPHEQWSQGKSGGKARTYMAAGVPVVCQDIGFNKELVAHGKTGFLAMNPDQWYESIKGLIIDHRLRQRMADQAYAVVKARYALQVIAPAWLEAIEEVADAGR